MKLQQLGIIIITWSMCGFIISVYDYLVLHTQISLGPSEVYSFGESVIRNVGTGFVGAVLGGSFMVFYVNVKYADKAYGYTIFSVVSFFLFVMTLVTIITGLILVPLQTNKKLSDPTTQQALIEFLKDEYVLKNIIARLIIVALTQLFLQINSKFGYGAFWNIIRGKYQVPVAERRIFMFLDLNQSTSIAERLGNETYHSFLKDFFYDITNPVLDCRGSIYQYVGDEVVISWRMKEGDEANCLRCFFQLRQFIETRKEKYLSRYGIVPTFRAGVHCGDIVAGEVGIVKRDITYSGDVLNTTSRIQGMCRQFQVELVVSHNVLHGVSLHDLIEPRELGTIKLRGKENELLLYTIKGYRNLS
ncbi:MAG TPA: adenylate/guanylate cyclase domain-containing protein [Ohtaekwangia sp.]